MKFDYEENTEEKLPHVASLYLFAGGPELCLAVKTSMTNGKVVWFYEDGEISVKPSPFLDSDDEEGLVKKFYKGDKITITL